MTEQETTQAMLMELIKEECTVNTTEVMEYPPTALSYGEKTIQTKKGDLTFFNGYSLWHGLNQVKKKDRKSIIFWWQ